MRKWENLIVWVCMCLAACQASVTPTSGLEPTGASQLYQVEYPLETIPAPDSAEYQNLMAALRQDARFHLDDPLNEAIQGSFCTVGERSGMCATLGSHELFAYEEFDPDGSGRVILTRDGTEIYRVSIGTASPLTNLRGLWTYDNHWVLEAVRVNIEQDGNATTFNTTGQILQDGELLNEKHGYDETYEFQLLNGRPFYLFRRGGGIDANFNGVEIPLGYDQIINYRCCSESTLNPTHFRDHLDFFAHDGRGWFYVEVGLHP